MSQITPAEVEKIAKLAYLNPTAEEIQQLTLQLDVVLTYVEQLNEVDTREVTPLAHPFPLHDIFAEDCVEASLPREEVMKLAPKTDGESFLVPAVL